MNETDGAALLRRVVDFADALRNARLHVPVTSVIAFVRSIESLSPTDVQDLYWAGRTTLVTDPNDIALFDRTFAAFVEGQLPDAVGGGKPIETTEGQQGSSEGHDPSTVTAVPAESSAVAGKRNVEATSREVLRHKRFDRLTEDERDATGRLMQHLFLEPPARRSRRRAAGRTKGALDVRRTLRLATATEGEALRRAYRSKTRRPRKLVLLLDVSGSMKAFSRALLQFGNAAMRSRIPTEVFCFGTSLTQVSTPLGQRDPDKALRDAAELVPDWEGGTRIAENLQRFIDGWGRRGVARGSITVICSDGLERGDPEELGYQVERLSRISHSIVWINPLKGDPHYRPTARGMAAALPHVDRFMPGHDLASLENLARLLSGAELSRVA